MDRDAYAPPGANLPGATSWRDLPAPPRPSAELRMGAAFDLGSLGESEKLEIKLAYEAAPMAQSLRGRLPTALELRQVSAERGPELAAVFFQRAVLASPLHAGFVKAVSRARVPEAAAPGCDPSGKFEAVVVPSSTPGYGPKWDSFTEDARACARRAGYATDWAETLKHRSVASNARAIADLVASKPSDARLVFVTFGQGAAELRFFLQKRGPSHPDLAKIRGWVNVAGAFGGAAILDDVVRTRLGRARAKLAAAALGRSYAALAESASTFGLWRERFQPPPRALIASLVPVPMPWHLPRGLRSSHAALAARGPSDGAVLLHDAAAQPGLIYPAWGFSHATGIEQWSSLLERTLAVFAEALADRPAEPPGADLSVQYNETDPVLRHERRLADRIAEQKGAAESAARRQATRALENARRRAAARAELDAAAARAEPDAAAPPVAVAPSEAPADPWTDALGKQTGRSAFDAIEWEMAQMMGKGKGSDSAEAKPGASDDDEDDGFRFL